MKPWAMAAALAILSACTQPEKATRILKADGYENIQMTGYDFFACSDSDSFSTGFLAIKNGQVVRGVVCAGFLKGATIRIK